MRAKVSVGTITISVLTKPIAEIEDECNRKYMKFTCELDKRFTRVRLNIGSIDHRQSPGGEPLTGDKMQDFEGVLGRSLIVLVIRNESTTEVGGKNFSGLEILPAKR
jgi:hypothetical protein